MTSPPQRHRLSLGLAVLASGVAGLTWEVLWQHHTALALGVSSYGTAITLTAMMAGLGLGGLLAARLARRGRLRRPLFAYGVAEAVIGVGALAVPRGLDVLSAFDSRVYAAWPGAAPTVHLAGMLALLLVPAIAMGTTLPILAPWARHAGTSIDILYGLNLAGALGGVLATTFVLIPLLGVSQTGLLTALLNFAVALWAMTRASRGATPAATASPESRPPWRVLGLAATSGFVVFLLEVSWFRSIRAALQSTTESFALILGSFLLALAAGSWLASWLRERFPDALPRVLAGAGLTVLWATPAVDGFDRWTVQLTGEWIPEAFSLLVGLERLAWILLPVSVPVTLLGVVFPWLLAEHATTGAAGRLYAVNTLGSVAGALIGGFVLLPWLGATHTSWLAGLAVLAVAAACAPRPRALAAFGLAAILGLAVAASLGGTTGRTRVQGVHSRTYGEVLYLDEGPDSTVWVARRLESTEEGETRPGRLDLVIDGFPASGEHPRSHYMAWMGHLPALAVPRPLGETLVICFGTGQTANAVREHRPERLYVVDVNRAVLDAAPLFTSNRGVLDDPAVSPVVMDGRAFLRREDRLYDLVTLEPMPPNFAGSNGLYSREFYELVRSRLAPGGVAAQWVPFHLLVTRHMRAVVATFDEVFPHTRLWIDPDSGTGILVGGLEPWELGPSGVVLPWPESEVAGHMELEPPAVAALAEGAEIITDDNQLLSYGPGRFTRVRAGEGGWVTRQPQENLALVRWFRDADEAKDETPAAAGASEGEGSTLSR